MAIPATGSPVSFYALNPDNTVSPITPLPTVPATLVVGGAHQPVSTPDGHSHGVSTRDGGVLSTAVVRTKKIVALDVPAGTDLGAYQWLELSTPSGRGGGEYSVLDGLDQSPNVISFNTLLRTSPHIFVQVGSCPQWRAFTSTGLSLLQSGGPKSLPVVHLVR